MQIAQTLDIGGQAVQQQLPGSAGYTAGAPGGGFGGILGTILSGIMVVAALMVLLYLIWGAIEWITSGGDKAKTEKARQRMTTAVIGIIVLASTLAIFMFVQNLLGLSILNFGGGSTQSTGFICNQDRCVCGDSLVLRGVRCDLN